MGTVPIGIGALRKIHSRVVWMLRPVERSITVSAPQRIAHTILSTSSSTEEVTAELPILALILVRKLRPMIIGSSSPWLMLQGMIARPLAMGVEGFRGMGGADIAVVFRLDLAALIFLDAAALLHPFDARARKPGIDVDGHGRIGVGA